MTALDLITAEQALTALGLYVPEKHKHVKYEYMGWLVERGLLTRYGARHKSYRYDRREVQAIFNRFLYEGLDLRVRPAKNKAA